MKCNECGNKMELYKNATHMHYIEKRWRCSVCPNETIDVTARKPKSVVELPKQKKKKE